MSLYNFISNVFKIIIKELCKSSIGGSECFNKSTAFSLVHFMCSFMNLLRRDNITVGELTVVV